MSFTWSRAQKWRGHNRRVVKPVGKDRRKVKSSNGRRGVKSIGSAGGVRQDEVKVRVNRVMPSFVREVTCSLIRPETLAAQRSTFKLERLMFNVQPLLLYTCYTLELEAVRAHAYAHGNN